MSWLPPPFRYKICVVGALFLSVIMTVPLGAHASAAANEAEARALFTKFVAAQNAHSVSGVKAVLWNSPGTLLLARGTEIRGPGAIADRFNEYYQGTWHVEPNMSLFHVTLISKDVMQFLVPVVFTRGLPSQPSQDNGAPGPSARVPLEQLPELRPLVENEIVLGE